MTACPDGATNIKARAPANLLLMGEYAVLEPGGLGLACAPAYHAVGSVDPEQDAGVTGTLGETQASWPGDRGVLGGVADWLTERYGMPRGHIAVDTTAFFDANGRKRGFGSSAALAVVLTALWLRTTEGEHPDRELVVRTAIAAHRSAQGGRGSGYDVATSTLGGMVLFRGGTAPHARRVELPWLPPFSLFSGTAAVATRGAVARYEEWRGKHENRARRFLARSNTLISSFVESDSWNEARPHLDEYRRLTRELGEEIGVSARIEPPAEPAMRPGDADASPRGGDGPFFKAVGAGNELGVLFNQRSTAAGDCDPRSGAPGHSELVPVQIAQEGLRWQ